MAATLCRRKTASENSVDLAVVAWANRGEGRLPTDCPAVAVVKVIVGRKYPLRDAVSILTEYNAESDARGREPWMILLDHRDKLRVGHAVGQNLVRFGKLRETYHACAKTA